MLREDLYQLKQFLSVSDYSRFVREVIDEAIQTWFEPQLRGRSVVNVHRNSDAINLYWIDEVGGMGAEPLAEGEEPPRIKITHSAYTIRSHKLGVAYDLSRELLSDVGLDIYTRTLRSATRRVAGRENQYIFNVLLNGVANGVAPKIAPVYDTHILDANNWTTQTLDHEKISYLISVLEDEDVQPNVALMSPAQFLQLQLLLEFKDTNGTFVFLPSQAESMVANAARKAFGLPNMQIIVDPHVPKDVLLIFDKTIYADFYEIWPLTIERIDDNLRFLETISLVERVACVAREPKAAAKLINLSYADVTAKLV